MEAWYQARRQLLFSRPAASPQDAHLSRLGRFCAKLTRRFHKGPCQALLQHHRTELRHAQGLKSTADSYLAEGLNEQALDVLRYEAERHFQLSFKPGEKIETF